MMKSLAWFDQFGALFQMRIFNQDHEFRSAYGGIVSLLIYMSIAAYSLYIGILWQTKQIPPTVVSQLKYVPEGMYLQMTSRLFVLSISNDQATDELHQLEEKGYLYNVQGTYYGIKNVVKPLEMNPKNYNCSLQTTNVDFFSPICLNPQEPDQQWFYQDATRLNDVYFDYAVTFCDPVKDHGCLSSKDAANFFTEGTTWRLTTIIQDVDLQTGEILDIPTDYYYQLDAQKSIDIQMKVVKAVLQIDDGFIFPNIRVIEIVKEIRLLVSEGLPQAKPGPALSISMERYQIELEIQFVKLASIIADITSWLQTLLLIGYFLSMLNSNLLNQKVKDALLHIYFPQTRFYHLEYNWRQKVKNVQRYGYHLEKEKAQQFIDFRKKMFSVMDTQFNQIHLLSQINKMQIALQLIMPQQVIKQLKTIDYQIKVEKQSSQSPPQDDQVVLDEEDFLMFQQLSSLDSKVHPFDNNTNSPFEQINDNGIYGNLLMNLANQNKPPTQIVSQKTEHLKVCIEDIE